MEVQGLSSHTARVSPWLSTLIKAFGFLIPDSLAHMHEVIRRHGDATATRRIAWRKFTRRESDIELFQRLSRITVHGKSSTQPQRSELYTWSNRYGPLASCAVLRLFKAIKSPRQPRV